MKTTTLYLFILTAVLTVIPSASGADPSAFPSSGLDAQSLGRGGTVIAARPGVWSSFGNPATLSPEGTYILGVDYIDSRNSTEKSWGLSVVDTSSSIRGSLSYYQNPDFAGFTNKMWGVSLCQTLMPSLYLGESFHLGEYEPELSPGSEESVNALDAGLLYKVGPRVSVGFVAHNLVTNDNDLFEQYNGIGIGLNLPYTIYFAADYEDIPNSGSDKALRAGIEFTPLSKITGRVGYQDLEGDNYITLGITYADANGTLDAGILYNEDSEKTDRVALGLSLRM